jgi:hypothetical protein
MAVAVITGWSIRYDIDAILSEIFDAVIDRTVRSHVA